MGRPYSARVRGLSGHRFGMLTALRIGSPAVIKAKGRTVWWCMCECGTEKLIAGDHLVSGTTRSCGCMQYGADAGRRDIPAKGHDLLRLKRDQGLLDADDPRELTSRLLGDPLPHRSALHAKMHGRAG